MRKNHSKIVCIKLVHLPYLLLVCFVLPATQLHILKAVNSLPYFACMIPYRISFPWGKKATYNHSMLVIYFF